MHRRTRLRALPAAIAGAALAAAAAAQTVWIDPPYTVARNYLCYRAEPAPAIDGSLDDPAWKIAAWTEPFVDIEGGIRPAPRFRTRTRMLWDASYFYIGGELEEPHVWGTLTAHDAVIFQDNDFEVFIDPEGDGHSYYEIEMNALNTVWDLYLPRPYKDGGSARNAWEIPGLRTAVRVDGTLNNPSDTDRGWTVELAIPWAAFIEGGRAGDPPRDGDQWRVNFSRVEWKHEIRDGTYRKLPGTREDNWVWSPQGVIDMHRPERWGYVQFTTARPGRGAFMPDPSITARELLYRLYYRQREFRKQEGRYAGEPRELGLAGLGEGALLEPVSIRLTADGFVATARYRGPTGPEVVQIGPDGRIRTGR